MKPCLGNKKYNYLLVIKQGVGKLRVIQFYKCIADKRQCRIRAGTHTPPPFGRQNI